MQRGVGLHRVSAGLEKSKTGQDSVSSKKAVLNVMNNSLKSCLLAAVGSDVSNEMCDCRLSGDVLHV